MDLIPSSLGDMSMNIDFFQKLVLAALIGILIASNGSTGVRRASN